MFDYSKEFLLDYYNTIKEERSWYSNIVAEEEYIKNIDIIDSVFEDFWKREDWDFLLTKIEYKYRNYPELSDGKDEEIVNMKDIVGTATQREKYSGIPWILCVPFLTRFRNNFPTSEEQMQDLFEKMRENKFSEKLELIKIGNKYYINEGNNRIIICKSLGLDYIKANIFKEL